MKTKPLLVISIAISFCISLLFAGLYLLFNFVGIAPTKTEIAEDDIKYKIVEVALEHAGIVDPNLEIIFTDDPKYNCGVHGKTKEGGCFRFIHPDTIYLSTGLKADSLRYVALHEYAHVLQYRNKQPLDECEADKQAEKWGASLAHSDYDECKIEK